MEVTPIIKAGTFLFNFKTFPEIGYKCPGTPDFFFQIKIDLAERRILLTK